jgi:hypothetical protein
MKNPESIWTVPNQLTLLGKTLLQLDEVGNTELLNWATLFGAIGRQPGELLCYTPTWHHGHAMMRFLPVTNASAQADQIRPEDARPYEFKNEGFEFYKHPPEV